MTLKTYLKLLVHVIITTVIVLSLPVILCLVLYNRVPDWVTIISSLSSSSITIFFSMKYMEFIVYKEDLFKDMF